MDRMKHMQPHGIDASSFLHPDHASIRTTSPRRAPANRSLHQAYQEPKDPYDLGVDTYSIGNLSIEPQAWQSTASISSIGTDKHKSIRSVRSIRSLKSLVLKSSRDSLRESDGEKIICKSNRKREPSRGRVAVQDSSLESPLPSPLPDITIPKRDVPSSVPWEYPSVPRRKSSVQSSKSPKRFYLQADDISGGPVDISPGHNGPIEDYIPRRDSSKRHSMGTSSTYPKRRSHQSEPSSTQEVGEAPVEDPSDTAEQALQEVEEVPAEVNPDALEQAFHEIPNDTAEDVVARRIKELKDQKLKRDRNSAESTSDFHTAPQTPERSVTPAPSPAVQPIGDVNTPPVEYASPSVEPEEATPEADKEKSAPPPAIAQRTKGYSGTSNGIKVTNIKHSRVHSREEGPLRSQSSPQVPQRSNSRLLKRLSQHGKPVTAGQHRRTYSNPLSQTNRSTSYQAESSDPTDDEVEEYLTSPRLNQKIAHAQTRRAISFSEVGDPGGSVVFCCVGMGLTRFLTAFYDELASTLKLRLITPDRPGVGGSDLHADGLDTPLAWPDDVRAICEHLKITKFSVMAHSAGAIYALATALRMPQHIRCRVHLLAPWIPPSQMSAIGAQQEPLPATALPYSQRILRALPTTFLRAANSSFLSTTSASITTSLPRSPRRSKRRSFSRNETPSTEPQGAARELSSSPKARRSEVDPDFAKENTPPVRRGSAATINGGTGAQASTVKEKGASYDARLTEAIWEAATTGANPAVDLLVCLERRQPIGFRYVDITRAVVIHHGSKDTRVPVENVKWLGKSMRRCEVRVLEGEGHGLMASAGVMGNVLMEMAGEWDDWNRVVKGRGGVERGGVERRVTDIV